MKNYKKKQSHSFKVSRLASCISLAITYSGTVFAEEANEAEEGKAAEQSNVVTVTANRREQSILEVPYNISAISGEALNDSQIVNAEELMRNMTGVSVVDRGHRNAGVINGISIRGLNVNSSRFGDWVLQTVPTVSTYVNDTPIYAPFALKDINRVEVLRGPQGTLYGSGSLGGTVRFLLNEPDPDDFEGSIMTSYSETDGSNGFNLSTDLVLNLPISDNSALRISAGIVDNDGIIDYRNVYVLDDNGIPVLPEGGIFDPEPTFRTVEDADTYESEYARISYLWDITDDFSTLLSYQTQDNDSGGRRQPTSFGRDGYDEPYGEYENGSVILEPAASELDLLSLEMEVDLGFATLTSSSSKYEVNGSSQSGLTGFYAQKGWLGLFYYNYGRPLVDAKRSYTDEAFVQEVRLVSEEDDTFEYVLGGYYSKQDSGTKQISSLVGFTNWSDAAFGPGVVLSDNNFDFTRDISYKESAIFGEATYKFSDIHRINLGARFFKTTFDNLSVNDLGLYEGFTGIDITEDKGDDNDSIFRINYSYDLSNEQMLYTTLSQGYRRGGTNAIPTSGNFSELPGWVEFGNDKVNNFEIGVKGSHDSGTYSIAAFMVQWKDIQIDTVTPNGFFAVINGNTAESKGVEMEFNGYLDELETLQYVLGYTHIDAKLTADVFAPGSMLPYAFDGASLPGTAEDTINLSLIHITDFDDGLYWTNQLVAYYQSDSEADVTEASTLAYKIDSFSTLNFYSILSGSEMFKSNDDWTISFWIKNITNEEGITGLYKEEYVGTSPTQNYFGNDAKNYIILPRTVGLTASYSF